jgi:hypothetical protein
MKATYGALAVLGLQIVSLAGAKLCYDGLLSMAVYAWLPTSGVLFYYKDGDLREGLMLLFAACVVCALNTIALKRRDVL